MDACRFLFFDNLFFFWFSYTFVDCALNFLGNAGGQCPFRWFLVEYASIFDNNRCIQCMTVECHFFKMFICFVFLICMGIILVLALVHSMMFFWMIFWISTSLLGPVTMVRSSSVSSVLATIDIFLKIIAASSLLGVLSYHELNSRYIMFGQCFGLNFLVKSLQIWSDLKTIWDDIGPALKLS